MFGQLRNGETIMQNDDLSLLGSSPDLPLGDLNLAGSNGVPDPREVMLARDGGLVQADYGKPDLREPRLSGDDPASVPLTFVTEFAPDPLLPDMTAGPQPFALNMYRDPLQRDELLGSDMPEDGDIALQGWPGLGFEQLQVTRTLQAPDALIPDLQHPEIAPIIMPENERPGDLAPDALDALHQSPSYQQIADKSYPEVYMDQRGVNNRRSRKFTLLMKGLDAEEQGREL
jgi:hypothetical protein